MFGWEIIRLTMFGNRKKRIILTRLNEFLKHSSKQVTTKRVQFTPCWGIMRDCHAIPITQMVILIHGLLMKLPKRGNRGFRHKVYTDIISPLAFKEYSKTGSYSMRHPGTNLRIIGLNPFPVDSMNSYIWKNTTNPLGIVYDLRVNCRWIGLKKR